MTYADDIDVYEHGIVVPDGERAPADLSIVATTRQPIYNAYSLTLVGRDGTSLNERAVHALEVPSAHAVVDYYEESDVRFFLRETLYHLNSVINMYVWACQIFDEHHGYLDGPQSGNTGDSRVLFEIDAYLGARAACTRPSRRCCGSITTRVKQGAGARCATRPTRSDRATRRCRGRSAIP